MTISSDDLLIQRLEAAGERLTWAVNSTVYQLGGVRFIVWTLPGGGWGICANLPYG